LPAAGAWIAAGNGPGRGCGGRQQQANCAGHQGELAINAYVHPRPGARGRLFAAAANSRAIRWLRRALFSWLPFPPLASDVEDVVYLTWIVPLERVRPFVPPGVAVIERAGLTLFTILTYRHRHFGAKWLGPLRRLCPSPLQSNWRLYVEALPNGTGANRTVLFLRNAFDHPAYVLGSRLASDALPSHLPLRFVHARSGDGYETVLDPGAGSAPALDSKLERTVARVLPAEFDRFFATWAGAVRFLCRQESAVVAIDGERRIAQAGISLPIDVDTVVPLQSIAVAGAGFLQAVGAVGAPFCFVVPKVRFEVLRERLIPAHTP
jgi:hypothetical protein